MSSIEWRVFDVDVFDTLRPASATITLSDALTTTLTLSESLATTLTIGDELAQDDE